MWDMAKKVKRIMKKRGKIYTKLTGPETRDFIQFWQNIYQNTQPPDLQRHDVSPTKLDETRIQKALKNMPDKKAPGPDGVTAELLKKGGTAALEMTT